MELHQTLNKRKSDAQATFRTVERLRYLIEKVEYAREMFGIDSDAGVSDA